MPDERFLRGDCDAFARVFQDMFGGDLRGLFDAAGDLHHVFVLDRVTGLAADSRGLMPEQDIARGSRVSGAPVIRDVAWAEVRDVMGLPEPGAAEIAAKILSARMGRISEDLGIGQHTLVVVHPGSVWASWAAEVDPEVFSDVTDALMRDIAEASEVVVIDGFLSDRTDIAFERAVMAAEISGTVVHRLWGCDAGEAPFPGWQGRGPLGGEVFAGQREAARAVSALLRGRDVMVTGAWANRTSDDGCVNCVRDVLREAMPSARVRISANAAFEPIYADFQADIHGP